MFVADFLDSVDDALILLGLFGKGKDVEVGVQYQSLLCIGAAILQSLLHAGHLFIEREFLSHEHLEVAGLILLSLNLAELRIGTAFGGADKEARARCAAFDILACA